MAQSDPSSLARAYDAARFLKQPLPYKRESFFNFWQEHIPLAPQELYGILAQDMGDRHITVGLDHCAGKGRFTLDARILNQEDAAKDIEHQMDIWTPSIRENGREFDLDAKTIRPGFITSTDMQGGRLFTRNQFELGYRLGCHNVEIHAVNVGAWLWTRGFRVKHVTHKYANHLRHEFNSVKNYIKDTDLVEKVEALITAKDVNALSRIDYDLAPDLVDGHWMDFVEKYDDLYKRDGKISLSKAIMIVHSDNCWSGIADLNDPQDCYRLGQCLGGWRLPDLKERAALVAQQSALSAASAAQTSQAAKIAAHKPRP